MRSQRLEFGFLELAALFIVALNVFVCGLHLKRIAASMESIEKHIVETKAKQ